jgi:hypothetical protein
MEKLRLDLDALTVESFEATEIAGQKGTVNGAQSGCSCGFTCGVASRGQKGYEEMENTKYGCCV